MNPKPTVEPATPEDIAQFSAGDTYPTLKAWVGKLDGEPIALFGLARGVDARWYAFFDITDRARPYKMQIVRTAKMVMDEARKMGLRYVYATADEDEPMAVRWMQSLGFEVDPRSQALMRWKGER